MQEGDRILVCNTSRRPPNWRCMIFVQFVFWPQPVSFRGCPCSLQQDAWYGMVRYRSQIAFALMGALVVRAFLLNRKGLRPEPNCQWRTYSQDSNCILGTRVCMERIGVFWPIVPTSVPVVSKDYYMHAHKLHSRSHIRNYWC
jgi:hypothetical protein